MLVTVFFACQSKSDANNDELTEEEKTELQNVETLQKTEKERADSALKHWEEKMEKSKIEE